MTAYPKRATSSKRHASDVCYLKLRRHTCWRRSVDIFVATALSNAVLFTAGTAHAQAARGTQPESSSALVNNRYHFPQMPGAWSRLCHSTGPLEMANTSLQLQTVPHVSQNCIEAMSAPAPLAPTLGDDIPPVNGTPMTKTVLLPARAAKGNL